MSDTFYLVVTADRHTDNEYALYRNIGAALAEAQRRVVEVCGYYHVDPDELVTIASTEWVFHAALEDAFSIHVEAIKVTP